MTKVRRVEEYLINYGTITTLEIQQLVWCTCPHGIIRDIREKHGYNSVTDEWITKTRDIIENGKKRKETIRYKKYIWNGDKAFKDVLEELSA